MITAEFKENLMEVMSYNLREPRFGKSSRRPNESEAVLSISKKIKYIKNCIVMWVGGSTR